MIHNGSLQPVAGFGFFHPKIASQLANLTKRFGNETDNAAEKDKFKCEIMKIYWQSFFPFLNASDRAVCSPLWDSASCVPPTPGGDLAVFPCMTMYENKYYDPQLNASRWCLDNGTWEAKTNYSQCKELPLNEDGNMETDVSLVIYYIGYSISLLSLFIAVCIFVSFREMRCLRHKIHISLFLTFILDDFAWILNAQLQNLFLENQTDWAMDVWCISLIILRYFHLSTFFWMFLEGLYLFLQVQLPLSMAIIRHRHFLCFGWISPLVVTITWYVLRITIVEETEQQVKLIPDEYDPDAYVHYIESKCIFIKESIIDLFSYQIPIFILLSVNTVFLIWIMVIVISKLNTNSAMEHDRQHWKAAKALIIVIPLLGITYLLTLMGPDHDPVYYMVFQIIRAIALSSQGFVITLPYCFFNSEVRGVVKNHWERWKLIRNVGLEMDSSVYNATNHRTNSCANSYNVSTANNSLSCYATYANKDKDKNGKMELGQTSNTLLVPGQSASRTSRNLKNNCHDVSFTSIPQNPHSHPQLASTPHHSQPTNQNGTEADSTYNVD